MILIPFKSFRLLLLVLFLIPLYGSPDEIEKEEDKKEEEKKIVTIAEKIKPARIIEGLFTLYQDTTKGNLMMIIRDDQIDHEYIHFAHSLNGVVEAGLFKGAYRGSKIFSIRKYFNKILFEAENTRFFFDPDNPLSNAAEANISKAVLASLEIQAQDKEKKEYLINIDDLFLSENLHQIKPSPPPPNPAVKPGARFSLGVLNKTKSHYQSINNYPENTDIVVEYVYDNPAPNNYGSSGVTDARAVSIQLQHSLILVPDNDYIVRYDDPRVGYFTTNVTDMTSTSPTPYKDLVHRWNLKKKDSKASLSDPVDPIVWWIENTTPHEFRDAVAKGVLRWNAAFEAAGFTNAMEVKIQPDDADWHAGDIRYNVLRWTSSPRPPFGGYGPSFVNPRTGQIIGADIMLEWVYFTNRVKYEELFSMTNSPLLCSAGELIQQGNLFASAVMDIHAGTVEQKKELINESLVRLTLHEIGHTLGLNHNFKSSRLHNLKDIHDKKLTSKTGLTGSVMEYPSINVAIDPENQGEYYTTVPGPYDLWAIEFGYSPELENSEKMNAVLARSTEPELTFANDADDMRAPGKGIDPHAMIYDLTSDAVGYSVERMKLVIRLQNEILDKYSKEGFSYHQLQDVHNILMREYRNAANTVSRYVGGVHVSRAFVGQKNAERPFTPVTRDKQKNAMAILDEFVFSPNSFAAPEGLYNYLQKQRRGFGFFKQSEDPKIHALVLSIQKGLLDHLLHKNVLTRLSNSLLYGNKYSVLEMMSDLTSAVIDQDLKNDVNLHRQNLQVEYVHRLIGIMNSKGEGSYDYISKTAAFDNLVQIRKRISKRYGFSAETQAHRRFLTHQINMALDDK